MKNIACLLIFSILIISTFAQESELLREDFNTNARKWSEKSDPSSSSKLGYGEYLIEQKKDNYSMRFWNTFETDPINDFYVGAKMKQTSGLASNSYGIVWNSYGWKNCNQFLINNQGMFYIYVNKNGVENMLVNSTYSAAINKNGYNLLSVRRTGKEQNYYINGEKVFTSEPTEFFGKSTGFILINKIAVTIDYIELEYLKKDLNLATNVTFKNKEVNMGNKINSSFSEIAPIISPDGKTLYVARKSSSLESATYDVWYSTRNNDNSWSPLINIGKPINNSGDNLVISVTPDGNEMLLEGIYNSTGGFISDKGISVTHKTLTGWSNPIQVQINNYYNLDEYESFCPTVDRNVLIMSVKRYDTYGGKDMYVSFKQEDGSYSEPKNMGKIINSFDNEGTPFIAPDNVTLYFYSQGHPGFGSADIFVTKRLDDTWLNWSKPQNLGPVVNSTEWDTYYSVSASGDYAYLVSSKGSLGGEDIYTIKLEDAEKPNPVVLIYGKVFSEKTKKPIAAKISYENLKTGREAGTAISDPLTGNYKIILPYGVQYGIRAMAKNHIANTENIDLKTINKYQEIEQNLYLVPFEVGETINLKNVFFIQGLPQLKPESFPELDRLVNILKENPTMEIELSGHTDNRASDPKLLYELSEKRVNTVKEYLVKHAINEQRIQSKGCGPDKPIASNDTPEGRTLNRRVEFKILKK